MENESGGNTSVVGGPNADGSYDYGLCQVRTFGAKKIFSGIATH